MPKHPDITVKLSGTDGNAFMVMAVVTTAMRKAGASKEAIAQYRTAAMTGDYANLLRVTEETVNVR